MKSNIDYTLYLCTDRDLMSTATVEESVEQSIKGGCTVVQLREKHCSSREFYQLALRVKKITDAYQVPLIINDRADIALACGAQGVHVGQQDLPVEVLRRIMGPDRIIGVSAATVEEAVAAWKGGADYLGVGAMYATATKTDARPVTLDTLREIRKSVPIPIVVIGGINEKTGPDFAGTGIDGFAVVSALVSQQDIPGAAKRLVEIFRSLSQ